MNEEKTNVMRILDGKHIPYVSHSYEPNPELTGEEIAHILGADPRKVFKTLITQGRSGTYYVFCVPVTSELNLKKAANASKEKSVRLIRHKVLPDLTGYVHGGCSPVGMKKHFPTIIHETALNIDRIYVSAGKVGFQVELSPNDLMRVAGCLVADIV